MKIYTYDESVVSLFPYFKERSWEPKADYVKNINDPVEADYIICPIALHRFRSVDQSLRIDKTFIKGVEELPYWKDYEYKHVFFDCSDFEVFLGGTSALLIRCNVRNFMLRDKNTIPWFWPVEDLGDYVSIPEGGFKYEASFQGWLSTNTRKQSVNSCKNILGNRFNHKTFNDFYGLLSDKEEQKRRRKSFLKSQQESKILLAPQSIPGVFPYRFYEAMSSGRIPALFCTGYHLPFQNKIDWDKCTLRFDAEQANNAGNLIKNFLENTTEEKIIEMGKYGREMWYKWLNRDKQPELIAYVLNERLKNENKQL